MTEVRAPHPKGAQPRASTPAASTRPVAKARPDPRPMRLALGGGAIAALSVMTVGLVPPPGAPPSDPAPVQVALADSRTRRVEPRIRYVQLRPGQKAPPGARVIDAAAPTPRIVVQRPTTTTPTVRRVTRTRQSGR